MAINDPTPRGVYKGPDVIYSDAAQATQKGYIIEFLHVPTGWSVQFPAVIDSFSETHSSNYSEEFGYSRMDPIRRLQNTNRDFNFVFRVANGSLDEARWNARSVNLLLSMMFPLKDTTNKIVGKPFIRVRFMNMAESEGGKGTLCVIQNLNYDLSFDEAVITSNSATQEARSVFGHVVEVYPRILTINIDAQTLFDETFDKFGPFIKHGGKTWTRMD